MNFSSFSLKVLTASLVLASTTGLAFAKGANYKGEAVYKDQAPCPAPVMLKDGFYIGAEGGYDSYRVRASNSFSATTPSGDSVSGFRNPALSATGWVGGLFLGYGRYLTDMFYLGGELLGTYSGAESSTTHSSTNTDSTTGEVDSHSVNTKVEVNGMWGLALLPGIRLNDTSLGYVRLGYSWVSLKGKVSGFTNETTGGVLTSRSFSGSKSNTSNGFNFGLGIETLLWDNWSVRTEYTHYYYNSFNANYSNAVATSTTKFNPSDNQFMLGINYHFA